LTFWPDVYQSQFANRGVGWVAGMGGRIAGCAHPLEKSATNFRNVSIHLLPSWQYILRSELPLVGILGRLLTSLSSSFSSVPPGCRALLYGASIGGVCTNTIMPYMIVLMCTWLRRESRCREAANVWRGQLQVPGLETLVYGGRKKTWEV
jgi:hypothetical protein